MAYGSESEDSGSTTGVQAQLPAALPVPAPKEDNTSVNYARPNKPFKCPIAGCGACFSRPWRLQAHISVHCGEVRYKCDYEGCSKGYTSTSHLTRHKRTSHSSGVSPSKLYQCPHDGCKAVLKTNQNLKKHYKRAHVSKVCPDCGESFSKTIQFKYHMQYHSGNFLFQCKTCNINFRRKTEYNRHMRKHALYICTFPGCVEAFENWSHVRKHLKGHKPLFVCYYCQKPSSHKGTFRQHVLTHLPNHPTRCNNLKKYTCFHCDSEISGKQSLRRHIKVMHFTAKRVKKPSSKPRKPRKDKGKAKPVSNISAQLSNIECSSSLNKILLDTYEPVFDTPEEMLAAAEELILEIC